LRWEGTGKGNGRDWIFRVERGEPGVEERIRLATVTQKSYTDLQVEAGKPYTYWVVVTDRQGRTRATAGPVTVYIPRPD
jgi:fibronectin type 3 domain-containing protein